MAVAPNETTRATHIRWSNFPFRLTITYAWPESIECLGHFERGEKLINAWKSLASRQCESKSIHSNARSPLFAVSLISIWSTSSTGMPSSRPGGKRRYASNATCTPDTQPTNTIAKSPPGIVSILCTASVSRRRCRKVETAGESIRRGSAGRPAHSRRRSGGKTFAVFRSKFAHVIYP